MNPTVKQTNDAVENNSQIGFTDLTGEYFNVSPVYMKQCVDGTLLVRFFWFSTKLTKWFKPTK